MLLYEVTNILPLNALGAKVGKFFAELSQVLKNDVLSKDTIASTEATMSFDMLNGNALEPKLLFSLTFNSLPKPRVPLPRPPNIETMAQAMLDKHNMNSVATLKFDTTREDDTSFSIDVSMSMSDDYVIDNNDEDYGKFAKAAAAAYRANIGDVDHVVHT